MKTTRERQIARALDQRVAQANVTAASNAVVIKEQVSDIAGSIPDDLADQIEGLDRRIREIQDQLPTP